MTALAPPPVEAGQPPRSPTQRRRAPRILWLVAVLVTLPAAAPIVYLVWTVLRPGGFDAGGIPTSRLLELSGATMLLVAAVTVTTSVLGVATAWLTTRTDLRGRRLWSTLVMLPLVIPSYVGALAMMGTSGNSGLMSEVVGLVGLPPLPVFSGFWAAWGALSLWNFSYVHLLAAPAMRRMDPALEEAARGLGASRWRTIRTVVIPQLRPAMLSGGLLVGLYVLSDFGAVSLLRYETFTRAIYTQFRGRLDVSPALFLSGFLVLITLVLVFIEQRSRGRAVLSANRPTRHGTLVPLVGSARILSYGFLGGVVVTALILPMSTLLWWAYRGLSLGNSTSLFGPELVRSGAVSLGAGALGVITALPLAILTVRYGGKGARTLEAIAWSTYSLPHLATGLGFLVISIRFVPAIYQSIPLLLIAYVAMFLPQTLSSAQIGLRQIGPNLEAASRGLGRGAVATLGRITLPLLGKSLVAGGALVFLTVMKELPATLVLRPTGFETLAVRIWSAASELFYTEASVAALLLVAVSAVPLYFLLARDLQA